MNKLDRNIILTFVYLFVNSILIFFLAVRENSLVIGLLSLPMAVICFVFVILIDYYVKKQTIEEEKKAYDKVINVQVRRKRLRVLKNDKKN